MTDFDANVIPAAFNISSLIWITSLNPGEQGITRRIHDDLISYLDSIALCYETFEPKTKAELLDFLQLIARKARAGLRPILHLDAHGDEERGIKVSASGEFILWPELVSELRDINVATDNNLVVVSGACYGMNAAYEVTLSAPCPFYMLIAPRREVSSGFLEDNIFAFYRDAFVNLEFYEAYERHLAKQFLLHFCERMLLYQLVHYVRDYCVGKGGSNRREELLTKAINAGLVPNRHALRKIRKEAKKWTRLSQAVVDRFSKHAATFLMGKPLSFDIRHVIALLQREYGWPGQSRS